MLPSRAVRNTAIHQVRSEAAFALHGTFESLKQGRHKNGPNPGEIILVMFHS